LRKTAEFSIQDRGCGIPQKDLPRIFGEFTRASNATTFKADGNGLGLYIVKGIVEHAGGSIKIESKEGKGTTVTVRLPMA
jgi:signal transduction histidine kinase